MQDRSKISLTRKMLTNEEEEDSELMSKSLPQCHPTELSSAAPTAPIDLSSATEPFKEILSQSSARDEASGQGSSVSRQPIEVQTLSLNDENRVLAEIHSADLLLDPVLIQNRLLQQQQQHRLDIPIFDLEGAMMDVDSRDSPPAQSPIHCSLSRMTDADSLASRRPAAESSGGNSNSSIWKPRGLTLSAYRRPENTIRLTESDPSRRLEAEYGLHGAGGASGVLGHGAFSTVRLAVRLSDGVQVAVKTIAKHEAIRSRRLRRVDESTRSHDNSSNSNGGSASGTSNRRYHHNHHYMEEWEILRRLQGHPHVIKLLDVFETTEEIQLVTEYCAGGELFDAIQKKQRGNRRTGSFANTAGASSSSSSEAQAAQITLQMLQALEKIHALNIVHRDVKPENILLASPITEGDSVHVKLCDFGVARPLVPLSRDDGDAVDPFPANHGASSVCISSDGEASPLTPGSRSRSFSTVGTDYYAAPELTYGGTYDTAVDVYSLGVTLYILLCGFPPVFGSPIASGLKPDDDSDGELFEEVLFPEAYWSNVSCGAKALLRRMLHPDPNSRVTAKDAQTDPWILEWVAPSKAIPKISPLCAPVDMNLVRSKLYKSLEMQLQELPPPALKSFSKRRRHSCLTLQAEDAILASARKRARGSYCHSAPHMRRSERRASTTALMALADLYRGVAAPSVIAAAATTTTTVAEAADRGVVTTPSTPDGRAPDVPFAAAASSLPLPAASF